MKNKVTGPFLFEEPMVTGDTFLAMMDNTALCHIPVGTLFKLHGAPFHLSCHVHAFLDREFPDSWPGRMGPIYWPPHFPDSTPLDFFFGGRGVIKDTVYNKNCKM
jgi:hypothetical protein